MDKETLSNYGWIVICVLVMVVMIALATPFGSFISEAVQSTTQGLFDVNHTALENTGLINIDDQSFDVPNMNVNYGTKDPALNPNDGTGVYDGMIYSFGDYEYSYNQYYSDSQWNSHPSQNGWGVRVLDKGKAEYGPILETINGEPITMMWETFLDCSSMVIAPKIPDTVYSLGLAFGRCYSLTTAPEIPSKVRQLSNTFFDCTSLKTYVGNTGSAGDFSGYKLPDNANNLRGVFQGCTSMIIAPEMPENTTDMGFAFAYCTNLVKIPQVPSKVTNMEYTFTNGYAINSYLGAPAGTANGDFSGYVVPNTVTNMSNTFYYCMNIAKAPVLSNNVTNLSNTFQGCTSLTTAPAIPNGVTNMNNTFANCSALTTAPKIPSTVTTMEYLFFECYGLRGSITIDANPSVYDWCLYNVDFASQGLTLNGASAMLDDIGSNFLTLNYCANCNGKCQGNH